MSLGLDTSVALRLVTGTPADQAEEARLLLANATAPAAISDLVVCETYFALRHHYKVPHADVVRVLGSLLADSRVHATGLARRVLTDMSARVPSKNAPGLVDRLILADYAREGFELATFDRDLARLAGVEPL